MSQYTNHPNYNCKITLESGEIFYVYSNWIHNQDLDHWQGWKCEAGYTRFYIDNNFNIWSGECFNDQLGNVLNDWNIKTDSVCKRKNCTGCTDDLITKKYEK